MFKNSKLGTLTASAGIIAGILYASKRNKSIGQTALYVAGFGVIGYIIGNQITKFYE